MSFFKLERNERKILWAIVLVALGLRLLLMIYFKSYAISIDNVVTMEGVDNSWTFGYEAGRIAKGQC